MSNQAPTVEEWREFYQSLEGEYASNVGTNLVTEAAAQKGALIVRTLPMPPDPDDRRVRVGRIIDRYSTGFLVRYGRIYTD